MKYLKIIIPVLVLLFTGCSKSEEGTLRIDSLSVDGSEFYCFQRVKMWMCVESDNLGIADYEWGCDGGSFSEGQGLSEACWIPPGTPGEYQVWCKVTIGKNTETRIRKMNVTHYFFDYFENATATGLNISSAMRSRPLTWAASTGLTGTVNAETKSCELKLSSTTAAASGYFRAFNDPELKMPFSCMATVGWTANIPTDSIKIGTEKTGYVTSPNAITYQFTFSRDPEKTNLYVGAMQFSWFPVGSLTNEMPVDPANNEESNGSFAFVQTGGAEADVVHRFWFYHPALKSDAAEYKKVAFNVSENFMVSIYVAGEKVYETDALNKWRSNNSYTGNFYLDQWAIVIPNGDGNGADAPSKIPTFYLANTVGQNTGYTYTGAEDN